MSSVYMDVMESNQSVATVSIRQATPDQWAYEIHQAHPRAPHRGTVTWTGTDVLALVATVLADHVQTVEPSSSPPPTRSKER